jgi:hypothetical protein
VKNIKTCGQFLEPLYDANFMTTLSNFCSHAGMPKPNTQCTFMREVEQVGRDPIHWVRREVSFALDALAKIISNELIIDSLMSTQHSNLPNSYCWSL